MCAKMAALVLQYEEYGNHKEMWEDQDLILAATAAHLEMLDRIRSSVISDFVPALARAVIARAEHLADARGLLDLSGFVPGSNVRFTTPEFRKWVSFSQERLTPQAQAQVASINQAGYTFPELIVMMLEQADYWVKDLSDLMTLAMDYLRGEYDHDK